MKSSRGFTIIELMVSITIGLMVVAAIIQLVVTSKNSHLINNDLAVVQESARVSVTLLSRSVRMADHWLGVDGKDVKVSAGITLASSIGNCNKDFVFKPNEGIRGYEGADSLSGLESNGMATGCLSHYVPKSDVLVVRYADGTELANVATMQHADNKMKTYVRGVIGDSATVLPATTSPLPAGIDVDGAGIYSMVYKAELYYLRACSYLKADKSCGDDIPTLTRIALNEDRFEEEPLFEGIEQLQFEYGLDTDNDSQVDVYKTASLVSANQWERVISVRVGVLSRSLRRDSLVKNAGKKFTLVGDMVGAGDEYVVPNDQGQYRRKKYISDIQIRNRLREG